MCEATPSAFLVTSSNCGIHTSPETFPIIDNWYKHGISYSTMHTCEIEVKHNKHKLKEKLQGSPLDESLSGGMSKHWSHDQACKSLEPSKMFFLLSVH